MTCLFFFMGILAAAPTHTIAAAGANAAAATDEDAPACVVLLHGLARTSRSMSGMAAYLRSAGFDVLNADYPSRHYPIQELSDRVMPAVISECRKRGARTIHFVTHSLGGILVRYYLSRHPLPELGRVVMLSPPNKGSQVVDKLREIPVFKWLNGPAGDQLGTDPASVPNRLGPADYTVGIITGDRSVNLILSLMIPGRDDGKVSVENAKLEGMTDFLVVHSTHPFIMKNHLVFRQTLAFLKNGMFDGQPPGSQAAGFGADTR